MNFEISGIFERSGKTFAPAGIISSVETLSFAFKRTGNFKLSFISGQAGHSLMLGPRIISTFALSSTESGAINIPSSVANFLMFSESSFSAFPESILVPCGT